MSSFLYAEINIFAVLIIIILLSNLKETTGSTPDNKLFRFLLINVSVILVFDSIGWILENSTGDLRYILIVADAAYFFMNGPICFFWLSYSDFRLYEDINGMKRRMKIYLIPSAILSVIALVTPFTGWIFNIDADGGYTRGPLFLLHTLLSWSVMLYSAVMAMFKSSIQKSQKKEREFLLLSAFSVFPILGGLLQIFLPALPLLWPSATLALTMLFTNLQNRQISRDALTDISNRGNFNRYLSMCAENLDEESFIWVMLLDIDSFKKINDTFGHVIGDNVLISVARALEEECEKTGDFPARYGGDEFAVVCIRKQGNDINNIISGIRNHTISMIFPDNRESEITCSLGYAVYTKKSGKKIDAVLSDADRDMYKNKNEKKAGR